jgi:hypothetical protein
MFRRRGGWRGTCAQRRLGSALVALAALAGCGSSGGAVPPGDAGTDSAGPVSDGGLPELEVNATENYLELDSCGTTPAVLANVAAGTYTITLAQSSLSKGLTTGGQPSYDDYVVVHLPLPAGDPDEDHRFFMLHGVGDNRSVTLPAAGDIGVMFIDSDNLSNRGQGVVTLEPGSLTVTVDPTTNVLAWQTGCKSSAANMTVNPGSPTLTLLDSTLSSGPGFKDDVVVIRAPSEVSQDVDRYVILNGVDASATIQAPKGGLVRAWFISVGPGGTGTAHLGVAE